MIAEGDTVNNTHSFTRRNAVTLTVELKIAARTAHPDGCGALT